MFYLYSIDGLILSLTRWCRCSATESLYQEQRPTGCTGNYYDNCWCCKVRKKV